MKKYQLSYPLVLTVDPAVPTKVFGHFPDVHEIYVRALNYEDVIINAREYLLDFINSDKIFEVNPPSSLEEVKKYSYGDEVALITVDVTEYQYKHICNKYLDLDNAIDKCNKEVAGELFHKYLLGENFCDADGLNHYLSTLSIYFREDEKFVISLFEDTYKYLVDNSYYEAANYLPIDCLFDFNQYELALKLYELQEDRNCLENTDEEVYLMEGICLYHLNRFDEALIKLHRATSDEDCCQEAMEYINKIEDRN